MFKCQITNKLSRCGEQCNKIVVKTREKVYREKIWEDNVLVDVEVGKGWEIVKEINATDYGLSLWNSWSDVERESFVRTISNNN